ncbi:HAMP domain-containing sensor histidine kinase [Flavobacterium sp.]|uniref:sensor histidine kinase n=1 Tax=Flavobacterium sp. TaxID=239 RepID=UPI0031E0E0F4
MKHFQLLDKDDKPISENLTTECISCFISCDSKGKVVSVCPKYSDSRRQGKLKTTKCTAFLCCDKTKTTKVFKEKLEGLSLAFPDLVIPKNEIENGIKKIEQQKVNRLVHNLTSINAYNIQEIYDFIPQSILAANWKEQINFIENEVLKNPKATAMMFLRIAKNNIHMKSEFSIYRKLDREDRTPLEFQDFHIKKILLNVLHTFFADFNEKHVYVEVGEFYNKAKVDYETIQIAFYHLIENALKYSKTNSKINIDFEDKNDFFLIKFKMTSIYILPKERELIFNEGYSGEIAKKTGKSGDGIGMWRIKQMMELNGGSVEVIFGDEIEKVIGISFSNNTFILKFNK